MRLVGFHKRKLNPFSKRALPSNYSQKACCSSDRLNDMKVKNALDRPMNDVWGILKKCYIYWGLQIRVASRQNCFKSGMASTPCLLRNDAANCAFGNHYFFPWDLSNRFSPRPIHTCSSMKLQASLASAFIYLR